MQTLFDVDEASKLWTPQAPRAYFFISSTSALLPTIALLSSSTWIYCISILSASWSALLHAKISTSSEFDTHRKKWQAPPWKAPAWPLISTLHSRKKVTTAIPCAACNVPTKPTSGHTRSWSLRLGSRLAQHINSSLPCAPCTHSCAPGTTSQTVTHPQIASSSVYLNLRFLLDGLPEKKVHLVDMSSVYHLY